jgi:hypothetical protein
MGLVYLFIKVKVFAKVAGELDERELLCVGHV